MLHILVEAVIDGHNPIDFLQRFSGRCTELLEVAAAGVMLADEHDELQIIAASDEYIRLLELSALQHQQGPWVVCYHTSRALLNIDLTSPSDVAAGASFAEAAGRAGIAVTHALPLRLHDEAVGVLNLFHTQPGPLSALDARMAQALADLAAIATLQQRTPEYNHGDITQPRIALHSRMLFERAMGILAERWHTTPDTAFGHLRAYARAHRLRLTDLARQVVDGTADIDAIHPS